jgi:hypothetical protein
MALFSVMFAVSAPAQSIYCAVCGQPVGETVIFTADKVAGGPKKTVCLDCSQSPMTCYLCGMPVRKHFKELSDQRVLCARDAKAVVLEETEAMQIAKQVKDSMDRHFSRFTTFTDAVTLRLADRVDIMDLYHVPGNDFDCPNVLGYTQRQTNTTPATYTVSLLSGLPAWELRATTAHEWSHTWIFENVSAARQKHLDRDAKEAFCELVSYLLMESQGEKAALSMIRSNAYTRGQILLFIDAERRFGFNEVVDWMKFGVDAKLNADALDRVREVKMPAATNTVASAAAVLVHTPVSIVPLTDVTLQGITWSATQPTALINDRTFSANEERKIAVGSTNVLVRCVAIRKDAVVVRVGEAGEVRTLKLKRQ